MERKDRRQQSRKQTATNKEQMFRSRYGVPKSDEVKEKKEKTKKVWHQIYGKSGYATPYHTYNKGHGIE